MAKQDVNQEPMSRGVDALIERLRDEGVSAGRAEADQILADARAEAQRVMDKANNDAIERLEEARRDSDAYRSAGEEALKTAMRDAVLDLKQRLMERFSIDVKRLVARQLSDPEVLRQIVLEICGRASADAGVGADDEVEFLLPPNVAGLEDLRRDPEELLKGKLTELVLGLTGEALRSGITFGTTADLAGGIRVRVKDKDIVLDLTDEAVAGLLLQHLQPRFRAILDGIVR
ncbi:hypothetical protein [Bauldia sp.]|uniref:hypothetical protein n=1 Tax=Bauldia sp. TaxID=2575872 RepID=UPI003BA9ACC5